MLTSYITSDDIHMAVDTLAKRISKDYSSEDKPVLLGVLTGAYVFTADLSRRLNFDHEVEFIKAHSYVGNESSGYVEMGSWRDLLLKMRDRNVILVEDIVDTGRTITAMRNVLTEGAAVSRLSVCCLLDKPSRRIDKVKVDYIGFSIPDVFVVGYGLDYNGLYRNLPGVNIYKE